MARIQYLDSCYRGPQRSEDSELGLESVAKRENDSTALKGL